VFSSKDTYKITGWQKNHNLKEGDKNGREETKNKKRNFLKRTREGVYAPIQESSLRSIRRRTVEP